MKHRKDSRREAEGHVRDLLAQFPALVLHKFLTGTRQPVTGQRSRREHHPLIRYMVSHPILPFLFEAEMNREGKRTRRSGSSKRAAPAKSKKTKFWFFSNK
jgi:hypothetical protein